VGFKFSDALNASAYVPNAIRRQVLTQSGTGCFLRQGESSGTCCLFGRIATEIDMNSQAPALIRQGVARVPHFDGPFSRWQSAELGSVPALVDPTVRHRRLTRQSN
jgi:hypothetical protein